ncbi:MAG: endonuclease/exonuclease/phosphatase family protein [Solirubrobacteraceae bacterium]
MLRLLTWNVAGRVRERLEAQLAAVDEETWDLICLQEVTPTTRDRWTGALGDLGYDVAISPWRVAPKGLRRLTTLVAARTPLSAVPSPELPWPERHVAARMAWEGGEIEVHSLHAPISQKAEQVKVRTLEALFGALAVESEVPRVLAGDLNTPAYESREGEVRSFARTRGGAIRPDYGERHDRAELALITELPARHGWQDAFRALHGYAARDRSWVSPTHGFGWRLDHILCSPGLHPVTCRYVHAWREARLSDHSAMWAELELEARV